MEGPKKITQEKYLEKSICPICHSRVNKSDYLNEIFGEEPQVEWIANLITHYRHDHITSWDKCWGRHGSAYRGYWFKDYEEEKSKVNERAKRQIIRKGHKILIQNGITTEHFKRLQNTTEQTIKVAEKNLSLTEKMA
jgi:NAD dependent epimerase/dehydratase family enzyme